MKTLVNQAFLHVDIIGRHVLDGHYDLVGPSGEIVLPLAWEHLVKPGWHVSMVMWPMPDFPQKKDAPMSWNATGSLSPQGGKRKGSKVHKNSGGTPSPPPPPPPLSLPPRTPLPDTGLPLPPPPPSFDGRLTGGLTEKKKKEKKKGTGDESMPRRGSRPHPPAGQPPSPIIHPAPSAALYGHRYADMVEYMSKHHMPHLQAVLGETCRHDQMGSVFCYDTLLDGTLVDIRTLHCSHDDGSEWPPLGFSQEIAQLRRFRTTNIRRRTIIVEDLSPMLIEALGSTFRMNPEFFEEHLNRSGYRSGSYEDSHPHLWNTNAVPKDYISIKWFRPVYRERQMPISDVERQQLIKSTMAKEDGVAFKWMVDSESKTTQYPLHLACNIFRREWPLTPNLDDTSSRREGKYPASLEERATMCIVDVEGCSVGKLHHIYFLSSNEDRIQR
jgi:hypothetical protein